MTWTQTESFLIEFISSGPEQTAALGERIARSLVPGSVVALRGGLGAGKTCFTAGIARGLGVKETITSPSYTIISEYRGKAPLYHIDAYRLAGDEDFENTGALDYLGGEGIAVVEWSERIPNSLPSDAVTVSIEITGQNSRIFHIFGLERVN
jgi:tRNA threonylcarbamoyladenosine biosynthesis protein TsaE